MGELEWEDRDWEGRCLCCLELLGEDGDDVIGLCSWCAAGNCPYCGGGQPIQPVRRRHDVDDVVTLPGLLTPPRVCTDGRECPCPSWCQGRPCLVAALENTRTTRCCAGPFGVASPLDAPS